MRIVVLVSGTGSNLQAVIDAVKSGELDVEIAAVGADRPDTYGVERSDEAGIETFVVNFNSFETRAEWVGNREAQIPVKRSALVAEIKKMLARK